AIAWVQARKADPDTARRLLHTIAGTVALLAIYALWHLVYFRDLLPLPVRSKGSLWRVPYEDYDPIRLRGLIANPLHYLKDSLVLHIILLALLGTEGRWRRW